LLANDVLIIASDQNTTGLFLKAHQTKLKGRRKLDRKD
jgi:hypothetical protein